MLGLGQLERHEQRKEELLRASAANRRELSLAAPALRNAANWVDAGIGVARNVRTAWDVVSPLIMRGVPGQQDSGGFLGKILNGVSLAQSAVALWKNWRSGAK